MKKIYYLFLLLSTSVIGQQTIDDSLFHGGVYRTYKLYVPASYSSGTQVPLVFNFHGYGSNSNEQMFYGDFRAIADTANFIIVHPQGTLDPNGSTYFNVGLVGGAADDLGFTEAIIDKLAIEYSIDATKVYSTGMSNGGYMSLLVACQLSDRFAAVASVTGSMVPAVITACNAQHPTAVMQIHGTADGTVPYNGIANFSASIPDVLSYWAGYNTCATPTTTAVPNTNLVDGCTAEKTVYPSGNNCVEVVHYKVIGGGHTWPGALFNIGVTNQDFSASKEIWKFFRKYNVNGLIGCPNVGIEELTSVQSTVYPNPSNESIQLKGVVLEDQKYEIKDLMGKIVLSGTTVGLNDKIDISRLKQGHYFVVVNESVIRLIKK